MVLHELTLEAYTWTIVHKHALQDDPLVGWWNKGSRHRTSAACRHSVPHSAWNQSDTRLSARDLILNSKEGFCVHGGQGLS